MSVKEKFLDYVSYDTQSDSSSTTMPSTMKQKLLAQHLADEMVAMGIEDAHMDEWGYVYGTIPANCETDAPVVGFIAHMDTTPDASGTNVTPRIIENYDGKDIVLNEEKDIVMRTEVFEHMLNYVGQDLIVTDGTTLLGADDKAGVAEIMDMVEYFATHPEVKHGTIKVGFTTDEEVGKGGKYYDIGYFNADFAYTFDGQTTGEINAETFNAADANVTIHGVQVHPGRAKDKMINAITVGRKFDELVPEAQTCEHVDGREGYYHMTNFNGTVSKTTMKYILRDFSMEGFLARKAHMRKIADFLNSVYGEGTVELELVDSYFSMYEVIKPLPIILEHARMAIKQEGIVPREVPIRGGTDGSVLSSRGLPCPNISTGYQNGHSVYEYVSTKALETCARICINLAASFVK